jgi:hypothetical protein
MGMKGKKDYFLSFEPIIPPFHFSINPIIKKGGMI